MHEMIPNLKGSKIVGMRRKLGTLISADDFRSV